MHGGVDCLASIDIERACHTIQNAHVVQLLLRACSNGGYNSNTPAIPFVPITFIVFADVYDKYLKFSHAYTQANPRSNQDT